jgi:putative N6-adenine-specific DNA methylase
MTNSLFFFAPCPRGLEAVLVEELIELGIHDAKHAHSGVTFSGSPLDAMRVNLESRIASRVLWQVLEARYRTEDDIYRAALGLPWMQWMTPEQSLKVETNARHCPLRSLDFVTLRIKDAACDALRLKTGKRPSVNTRNPDFRIHAYLDDQTFSLYLDTSGESLFRRGLRPASGDAPLKKNLAAGLLRLAEWKPGIPLLDPFCGSGTLLQEAAEWSLNRAPGLGRHFGFEQFKHWDLAPWKEMVAQAEERAQPPCSLPLWGYDLKGDALVAARANLQAAGLDDVVQWKQVNALESSPPAPEGMLITNPPYGVRLTEGVAPEEFYPAWGATLKQRYSGWTASVFTARMDLPRLLRLKETRRTPLFNGALECRLFRFPLVAGSNRKPQAL